MVIIQVSFCYP